MDKVVDTAVTPYVWVNEIISVYTAPGVIVWLWVELLLIFALYFGVTKYRNSSFIVFFEMIFEKAYDFFEEILGIEEKKWTKLYIVTLFFIILISNFLGIALEILAPIFGQDANKEFILEHYISIPTADRNFNVAMAIVWVLIVIYEQFKFLGFWKALYEYFPVLGKDYIPYERGNMKPIFDWPIFLLVKTFDIIISLFLGVLEIVGHLAKVISLAMRLAGNMTSGTILLGMLVFAVSSVTTDWFGIDFPVIAPIIIYLQEILVALIQALVFPLLIAIFIKVAKVH